MAELSYEGIREMLDGDVFGAAINGNRPREKERNMKHYKLPELIAANLYNYGVDESKLTEQDCVNEAGHEFEVMQEWDWSGDPEAQYGEDYGRLRRQLTSYLTRQRKRGLEPNNDYGYLDDPSKKL